MKPKAIYLLDTDAFANAVVESFVKLTASAPKRNTMRIALDGAE